MLGSHKGKDRVIFLGCPSRFGTFCQHDLNSDSRVGNKPTDSENDWLIIGKWQSVDRFGTVFARANESLKGAVAVIVVWWIILTPASVTQFPSPAKSPLPRSPYFLSDECSSENLSGFQLIVSRAMELDINRSVVAPHCKRDPMFELQSGPGAATNPAGADIGALPLVTEMHFGFRLNRNVTTALLLRRCLDLGLRRLRLCFLFLASRLPASWINLAQIILKRLTDHFAKVFCTEQFHGSFQIVKGFRIHIGADADSDGRIHPIGVH